MHLPGSKKLAGDAEFLVTVLTRNGLGPKMCRFSREEVDMWLFVIIQGDI